MYTSNNTTPNKIILEKQNGEQIFNKLSDEQNINFPNYPFKETFEKYLNRPMTYSNTLYFYYLKIFFQLLYLLASCYFFILSNDGGPYSKLYIFIFGAFTLGIIIFNFIYANELRAHLRKKYKIKIENFYFNELIRSGVYLFNFIFWLIFYIYEGNIIMHLKPLLIIPMMLSFLSSYSFTKFLKKKGIWKVYLIIILTTVLSAFSFSRISNLIPNLYILLSIDSTVILILSFFTTQSKFKKNYYLNKVKESFYLRLPEAWIVSSCLVSHIYSSLLIDNVRIAIFCFNLVIGIISIYFCDIFNIISLPFTDTEKIEIRKYLSFLLNLFDDIDANFQNFTQYKKDLLKVLNQRKFAETYKRLTIYLQNKGGSKESLTDNLTDFYFLRNNHNIVFDGFFNFCDTKNHIAVNLNQYWINVKDYYLHVTRFKKLVLMQFLIEKSKEEVFISFDLKSEISKYIKEDHKQHNSLNEIDMLKNEDDQITSPYIEDATEKSNLNGSCEFTATDNFDDKVMKVPPKIEDLKEKEKGKKSKEQEKDKKSKEQKKDKKSKGSQKNKKTDSYEFLKNILQEDSDSKSGFFNKNEIINDDAYYLSQKQNLDDTTISKEDTTVLAKPKSKKNVIRKRRVTIIDPVAMQKAKEEEEKEKRIKEQEEKGIKEREEELKKLIEIEERKNKENKKNNLESNIDTLEKLENKKSKYERKPNRRNNRRTSIISSSDLLNADKQLKKVEEEAVSANLGDLLGNEEEMSLNEIRKILRKK